PLGSAAHQRRSLEQTNPTHRPRRAVPSDAQILAEAMGCMSDDPTTPGARSTALPGAPQRSAAHHTRPVETTNPNSRELPSLTPTPLAAARLVGQEMTSADVAIRLGTIRQTINRWKRLPAFIAELRRLHDLLVSSSPVTRASGPCARRDP